LNTDLIDYFVYRLQPEGGGNSGSVAVPEVVSPLSAVLGTWHCKISCYTSVERGSRLFSITFTFHSLEENQLKFHATSQTFNRTETEWTGTCTPTKEAGFLEFFVVRTFEVSNTTQYWRGSFDIEAGLITGDIYIRDSFDRSEPPDGYDFCLSQTIPLENLRWRPNPYYVKKNKAKSLWVLATAAVLANVRRRLWCWSYFAERRNTRKMWIEFQLRLESLSYEEDTQCDRITECLLPMDAQFYFSLVIHERRSRMDHRYTIYIPVYFCCSSTHKVFSVIIATVESWIHGFSASAARQGCRIL